MIPQCRHCRRNHVTRPRGLCWTCYYTPGVKERYPSTSKYAFRRLGNFTGLRPLPAEPTDAPPGSKEKLAVMSGRASRGESLFHPDDCGTCEKAKRIKANLEFIGRIRKLHMSTQDRGGHAE